MGSSDYAVPEQYGLGRPSNETDIYGIGFLTPLTAVVKH